MFYDDLPIWGFIGKVEKIQKPAGMEKRYHLFTHGERPELCLTHISAVNVMGGISRQSTEVRDTILAEVGVAGHRTKSWQLGLLMDAMRFQSA